MRRKKGLKAGKTESNGFKVPVVLTLMILALMLCSEMLQASENQPSVYDKNIRQLLQRQEDFGNLTNAYRNLDRIIDRIKNEIPPQASYSKEEAIQAMSIIGLILRFEENFEYSKNRLLIVELNKTQESKKYLDCDDFSSIYLAAAEHIGLNLKPVYFPDHVFLLCEPESGDTFFWESTMAEISSIDIYRQWPGVSFDDSYPILLNETQLEAIQLSDLGVAWFFKGNYLKASEYFQKSLNTDSALGTAYNNLGASLARQGKLRDALDCYQTAIDINPNNSTAFLNTGVAFYKLGDFRRSIKYFEESIKINPGYNRASLYKYRVLLANGEPEKAVEFLNELRRVQY